MEQPPTVGSKLRENEQTEVIEEKLPYDIDKYKQCFTQCKKEYPLLDDFFIHLVVVHYLMNHTVDLARGEELQKTYFKDEVFEGITSTTEEV